MHWCYCNLWQISPPSLFFLLDCELIHSRFNVWFSVEETPWREQENNKKSWNRSKYWSVISLTSLLTSKTPKSTCIASISVFIKSFHECIFPSSYWFNRNKVPSGLNRHFLIPSQYHLSQTMFSLDPFHTGLMLLSLLWQF